MPRGRNILLGYERADVETLDRFRRIVTYPERRPVFVHCSSINMVGAVLLPDLIQNEGSTSGDARDVAAWVGQRSDELERAAFRHVEGERCGFLE